MIMTSPNFLRVMGIPVEEGRDFSLSDELSEEPVYIFNETAKLAVNMEQGDILQSWIPRPYYRIYRKCEVYLSSQR